METMCTELRNKIRDEGQDVKDLLKNEYFKSEGSPESFVGQHAEMKANIMLSYRHLEDARMRIGKVMQQMQGGTSIFDKAEQEKAKQ